MPAAPLEDSMHLRGLYAELLPEDWSVRTLVSPRELRTKGEDWIKLDPPACELAYGRF